VPTVLPVRDGDGLTKGKIINVFRVHLARPIMFITVALSGVIYPNIFWLRPCFGFVPVRFCKIVT
jgi:hypothetical protein